MGETRQRRAPSLWPRVVAVAATGAAALIAVTLFLTTMDSGILLEHKTGDPQGVTRVVSLTFGEGRLRYDRLDPGASRHVLIPKDPVRGWRVWSGYTPRSLPGSDGPPWLRWLGIGWLTTGRGGPVVGFSLTVPLVLPLILILAVPAWAIAGLRRAVQAHRWLGSGHCPSCGYNWLVATPGRCPECGQGQPAGAPTTAPPVPFRELSRTRRFSTTAEPE